MKTVLRDLISEIQADKAAYDEQIMPSATSDSIQLLQARCLEELNYAVPAAYLDLLNITDGIDSNGIMLYGTHPFKRPSYEGRSESVLEGLVEANLLWRIYEPNKNFVFFAETGEVLYCHNLTANRFEIVDRVTTEIDDETNAFNTFEELLEKILNHMLDRYN